MQSNSYLQSTLDSKVSPLSLFLDYRRAKEALKTVNPES